MCFLLILCLAFTACSGPSARGGASVLAVASAQEPPTLDLHKNSSLIARQIGAGMIWEKLVTLNAKGEAVPELAESFDVDNGGRVFTFRLRRGVPFHDGSTMDAADVCASLNRWLENFSAVREMAAGARFEAVDSYTVRIQFGHAAVCFPEIMAGAGQAAIITTEEACRDEDGRGFMRRYVGTGPYKFAEWKSDQYVLLEKFGDYAPYGNSAGGGWAAYKAPVTDKIYFYHVPQSAARIAGLKTGQFHIDYDVYDDDLPAFAAMKDVTVTSYRGGTLAFVFNKKQGPAADAAFRRAVNAACDPGEVLRAVFGSQCEPGASYMEEGFWYVEGGIESSDSRNKSENDTRLSPSDDALASLFRGSHLRILTTSMGTIGRGALAFAQQMEKAGFRAEIESADWAAMLRYREDPGRWDVYTTYFAAVPSPALKPYFGPSYPGWTDDEKLTRLLEAFNAAQTREEARRRWKAVQEYCWTYLPIINMGYYNTSHAWKKNVENISVYQGLGLWNARVR